jgi:hypothetical protein
MSKHEKLKQRLLRLPNDFTFDEIVTFLSGIGYEVIERPRSSGSAVMFYNSSLNDKIMFHKPHPRKELKKYILMMLIDKLKENKLI